MKAKKKVTWEELEKFGLDENLYVEYCETMDNIDGIYKETLELFEQSFICANPRVEYSNLMQMSAILDNEVGKMLNIIDNVLAKADEVKNKV